MPVITVTGLVGSGNRELAVGLADALGLEFVDRRIISEAAGRVGASVEAVEHQVEHGAQGPMARRLVGLFERIAARGNPTSGFSQELFGEYRHVPDAEATGIRDSDLVETLSEVMREAASGGNVVLVGRGANKVLADWPGAIHLGSAAGFQRRVERIQERDGVSEAEATAYVTENDAGLARFYHRFFNADVLEPTLFHAVLNTERMPVSSATEAAARIVEAAPDA
ncbi:MAG: cytidylate kinase-like family protein [Chloroflexota bacterium]|nr:cytidylate kinase-like family protein [Chloroflexota bacterium]